VKILKPELVSDPDIVARFFQERSILLSISHPNVVRVVDLVVEGQTLAIVMEFIKSRDLRHELLAHHTLPPAQVARYGCEVLNALAAVHAAGIVHRDVKPENMLLDTSGNRPEVKLTDFGVARLTYGGSLTKVSSLIGTPEYMAPELAEHESATPAVDLYATGIVLYEMLAGRTPFAGGHPIAVLRRHIDDPPPLIPGAPVQLWTFIAPLLVKDPDERPKSAAQLAAALAVMQSSLADLPALPPMPAPVFHPAPRRAAGADAPVVAARSPKPAKAPAQLGIQPETPETVLREQADAVARDTPPSPAIQPSQPVADSGQAASRSYGRRRAAPIYATILAAVLVVAAGAAVWAFRNHPPTSELARLVRPVSYVFAPQVYPDGLLIVRRWTLSGPGGSILTESVATSSSDGRPHQVTFFEAIPTAIAATVQTVRFTPAPTVVSSDPVVQWQLNLPAQGTVTVGYLARVPPEGATTARLAAWARDLVALQLRLHLNLPATVDIQSLNITPSTMSMFENETLPLSLKGQLASGSSVSPQVLAGAEWTSASTAIATVSTSGVVTATGVGSTYITARVAGVLASASLVVSPAPSIPVVTPSAPAPVITPTAGPTIAYQYKVFHSCRGDLTCGLLVHSGPGTSFGIVGNLINNEPSVARSVQ
jgi:hypothetical protein